MPYKIKEVKNQKYKVCKVDDPSECFSKKGLPKKTAKKQKIAIEISERRKRGGGVDYDELYDDYLYELGNVNGHVGQIPELGLNEFVEKYKKYSGMGVNKDIIIQSIIEDQEKEMKEEKAEHEEVYYGKKSESKSKLEIPDYVKKLAEKYEKEKTGKKLSYDEFTNLYVSISNYANEIDEDTIYKNIMNRKIGDTKDFYDIFLKFMMKFTPEGKQQGVEILYEKAIHNGPTSNINNLNIWDSDEGGKINYNDLVELYEYLKEKIKEGNDPKNLLGVYVKTDVNQIDDDKLRQHTITLTAVVRYIPQPLINSKWCYDATSKETMGFNHFQNSDTFAVVIGNQYGKIFFYAGADIDPRSHYLYIATLCGSPAYPIFKAFRKLYDDGSKSDTWGHDDDYKYLTLGSLSYYNTVQFYLKQGMLTRMKDLHESYRIFNIYIENYKENGVKIGKYEYAKKFISQFDKEYPTGNEYLNELFRICHAGGDKYLFPEISLVDPDNKNNKIGQNAKIKRPDGGEYSSVNLVLLFRDKLQKILKEEAPSGSGMKGTKFYEELRRYGINPEDYLKQMKIWAKKSGYDEKQLSLNNNDKHKLRIMTENGTKNFGRVGYKDYYIYRHLEKKKEVPKGTANKMRNRFRRSHEAISNKRKLGRNTPNELSLKILWHESSDDIKK